MPPYMLHMTRFPRALRRLALVLPVALLAPQALPAQAPAAPAPRHVTPDGGTPWIYEGSDVPRDREWVFGELPNGLRYAVRRNGVPPGQVSVRVRRVSTSSARVGSNLFAIFASVRVGFSSAAVSASVAASSAIL